MSKQEGRAASHVTGVVLVVISAVVFSTAGVFTKGVDAGSWEIIFWRCTFAAGFTMANVMWRGSFKDEFLRMGASGWAIALVGASGSAAFIPAFKLTTMANVMLIYAAAPLLAALLAWLWIQERLTRRVVLGCIGAIIGVGIIVQGSFGAGDLRGDLLALWMTVAMATIMVIYRRYPGTPAAGPAALSSIVLLLPGVLFGAPFAVALGEFVAMAAFGLSFAIASVTLAEGMKRIPAGETALLSALETPLAPIFGWMFFAEVPPAAPFAGGALIMVAVIGTQVFAPKRPDPG